MFNLYLILPYTSYEPIIPLDIENGGVSDYNLELSDKTPYILELTINPTLNCYKEILENPLYGIRLQTYFNNNLDQDLVFVRSREETIINQNGEVTITFLSNLSRLIDNIPRQVPRFQVLTGSAIGYIPRLVPGWQFNFISPDKDLISCDSGDFGTWKLLSELCNNLGNWTFRDGGIKNGVQTIDIGDFTVLDNLYTAETELNNNTEILLTNIQKEQNDNIITHIYPKIDSGNSSSNNFVFLTNQNASFINPDYPLEALGDLIFRNGETLRLFNVINKKAVDLGYPRKQKDEVYSNIQEYDDKGQLKYSDSVLQEIAYRKVVKTLREQGQTESYKLDLVYKRLVLPCSKVYIKNFVSYFTNRFGQQEILNIKDKTFYQNNISINLADLYE